MKRALQHTLKPILYAAASAYVLIDVLFLTVAEPLSHWMAKRRVFDNLRAWIASLRPYPTLALFAVPVIILEPVKPVSAYLVATGHLGAGLIVLAGGEILKLVLLERLFNISKAKLLSIGPIAWAYGKYGTARNWLEATEVWHSVTRLKRRGGYFIYGLMAELRALHRPQRQISQMR